MPSAIVVDTMIASAWLGVRVERHGRVALSRGASAA
jgi:hypothetical protein